MVIDQLPPPGFIIQMKGLVDFYAYHICGHTIYCAREWPSKAKIIPGSAYEKTLIGASNTIKSYRTLHPNLIKNFQVFFKSYAENYLDFFRWSFQSKFIAGFSIPYQILDIRTFSIPADPQLTIQFFSEGNHTVWINEYNFKYKSKREVHRKLRRGVYCDVERYIRVIDETFTQEINLAAGWSGNIFINWDSDFSIFTQKPSLISPSKPFFGPVDSSDFFKQLTKVP